MQRQQSWLCCCCLSSGHPCASGPGFNRRICGPSTPCDVCTNCRRICPLIFRPLFAVLGWHFLPRLVPFLVLFVGIILFVFLLALVLTLVFLFLVLSDGAKLRIKLELALEGIDHGCHGHNLFVVGRFGSPHPSGSMDNSNPQEMDMIL